jgi:hypothetical protein
MSDEPTLPIERIDADQDRGQLEKIADAISAILTPGEEILYVVLQNVTAMSPRKDAVVTTNNRIILYRAGILGRISFDDFLWQDIKNVHLKQGMMSTEVSVEAADGRKAKAGGLSKEQAKRLYAISQQMEQEWREKRRVRQMEESRAAAGGVYLGSSPVTGVPSQGSAPDVGVSPAEKLGQAKAMLEAGLISEAEYESIKAKIISAMT